MVNATIKFDGRKRVLARKESWGGREQMGRKKAAL
jgi:hypothetical protein